MQRWRLHWREGEDAARRRTGHRLLWRRAGMQWVVHEATLPTLVQRVRAKARQPSAVAPPLNVALPKKKGWLSTTASQLGE